MKTIVRIGAVLDSQERVAEAKFAPFGAAMLADAFHRRRADHPEALLIVEQTPSGPVYIIVGPNPPELMPGTRRVFAVFDPPDSQEPIATFFDEAAALAWVADNTGAAMRQIDATDRLSVKVSVALIIKDGADQVLYCRLAKRKEWALPEGELLVGETAGGAGVRAASEQLGIDIGEISIPGRVPYVNAYIPDAGHFLALVLVCKHIGGTPTIKTELYDEICWAPAGDPPKPQFLTIRTINRVLALDQPKSEPKSEPKLKASEPAKPSRRRRRPSSRRRPS